MSDRQLIIRKPGMTGKGIVIPRKLGMTLFHSHREIRGTTGVRKGLPLLFPRQTYPWFAA